jgi:peptidoglycan/LPS O-acetylase OafA/YrhL
MDATPRYRLFGALRFALALLVIFQHYGCTIAGSEVNNIATQTLTGAIAVQVFFALSGFIILEAALSFYRGRPVAFLLNRAIRILLPFWVVVIATWAIYALIFQSAGGALSYDGRPAPADALAIDNLLKNMFYIWPGNVWPVIGEPIPFNLSYVFWTVRFESVFYLLCAVVLTAGIFKPRIELPLIYASIIAFAALFFAIAYWIGAPGRTAGFDAALAQLFSIGALAFAVKDRPRLRPLMIVMLAIVIAAYPYVHSRLPAHLLAVQIGLLVALLLTAWTLADVMPSERLRDWDERLGDLSYPLYLIHVPVQIAVKNIVGDERSTTIAVLAALAAIVISFAFARLTGPLLKKLRTAIRGQSLDANSPKQSGGFVGKFDIDLRSGTDHASVVVFSNAARHS